MRRGIEIAAAVAALILIMPQGASAQSGINYPEDVRDALRQLMSTYEHMSPGSQPVIRHGQRVRESLDSLDTQQLELLYRTYTASPKLMEAVAKLNQSGMAAAASVDIERTDPATYGALAAPTYSDICGADRVDAETAYDQLTAWQEMQLAASSAQGDCDAATSGDQQQDNVDVCPVAAMANEAALTARFAYEMTLFCSRDIDSAEISATLATTGEIQTGLADHDQAVGDALSTLGTDLGGKLQTIDDALATHDAEIKQAIESVSTDIEGMFQQVLDNQQAILANQEAIMMLLLTPQGRRPGWNGRPEGNNGNGNGNGGN